MKSQRTITRVLAFAVLLQPTLLSGQDLTDRVEHHYADSDGVKIHYVTLGEGPLVIMIHGFPDYWLHVAPSDGGPVCQPSRRGNGHAGIQPE